MTRIEHPGLILEKEQNIAIITLNRPDKLNALDVSLARESIPNAIEDISKDDNIRAAIMTGAGRGFCSGGDVSELRGSHSTRWSRLMPLGWIALNIQKCRKPIIGAINGPAAGAGFSLALLCDLRIVSEEANFSMVFVNMGLVPDAGATHTLSRVVGLSNALRIMLTGDKIDAQEAKRIGLADEVVPAKDLIQASKKLAGRIAERAPIAVELTKRAIYAGLGNTLEQQLFVEGDAQRLCMRSGDHKEALQAFTEKRKPVFKG